MEAQTTAGNEWLSCPAVSDSVVRLQVTQLSSRERLGCLAASDSVVRPRATQLSGRRSSTNMEMMMSSTTTSATINTSGEIIQSAHRHTLSSGGVLAGEDDSEASSSAGESPDKGGLLPPDRFLPRRDHRLWSASICGEQREWRTLFKEGSLLCSLDVLNAHTN
jgi:hypothetical protein